MNRSRVTIRAGSRRRRLRWASAVILFALVPLARADDSLARLVPADTSLFIELERADDLLTPLTESQVWLTLARLAGQPAAPADIEQWRRNVEQTVRMQPEEAIRTLFSRRMAYAAPGPRRTQDAVILCQPAGNPRDLIARWQARPLPSSGRTPTYRLPNNVGLALRGDVLIFGDAAAGSMFERVVTHLDTEGAPDLARDSTYRRLLARLPPDPVGVLFARLDGAAATSTSAPTQPTSSTTRRAARSRFAGWPGVLGHAKTVALALHRDGRLLRFSAAGDARQTPAASEAIPVELVSHLPQRTLVAWASAVDYAALLQAVNTLPKESVLRVAYQLHERDGRVQRLTDSLTPAVCVAVGVVDPEKRRAAAPPVPAIAILARSRAPEDTAREWGDLLHYTLDLYQLLALNAPGAPQVPPIEELRLAERDAECADLSALLGPEPAQTPLGELQLCWAMDGDVLIIASHKDWLRQILAARQGAAPRLADLVALGQPDAAPRGNTLLVAQPGPLADLGALWLDYFQRAMPTVLDERWWRNYQPRGGRVRLGVRVQRDAERQRLMVREVDPGTPADGLLRPGDEIIGCNGRRFATSQPDGELRRGLIHRPNTSWFDLWIERDQTARQCRLPLPFVDPVQILRRIVAVGKIVQRVVYSDDAGDADGPRGQLAVELRGQEGPLFAFHLTPTSAPASAPLAIDPPPQPPARPVDAPPAPPP